MAQVDLMVVSPHPDDAEFGIAGTVARLVREGKTVVYVVCTSGEKGTDDRTVKSQDLAKRREQEQTAAAAILGVREVVFLRCGTRPQKTARRFARRLCASSAPFARTR